MKKDRNSFFSQYGVSSYNSNPYMIPNMMPFDNNMNNIYPPTDTNNIESRINKIEREIKLIDQRLSKLESELNTTLANNDYNFANSMYMV